MQEWHTIGKVLDSLRGKRHRRRRKTPGADHLQDKKGKTDIFEKYRRYQDETVQGAYEKRVTGFTEGASGRVPESEG